MADRKPYFGPTGNTHGGRQPYFGGSTAPKQQEQKKSRGGILGIPGKVLGDLETAAVNSPGGIYQLGTATAHDTAGALGHLPGASPYAKKASQQPSQLLPIAKQTVAGAKQDVTHPLRHPGLTLLDALAVASLGAGSVARGAAVAGRIGEGARASEIAAAALRAPKPGVRVLRAGPLEVTKPASRSALARGATRQIDTLRNRFPDAHLPVSSQYTRVGKELARQRTHEYRLHTTPFEELKIAGRKIHPNSPRGRALRAVAEGTPIEDVVRTAAHDLSQTTNKFTKKQLRREIRIALDARKYVNNERLPNGDVVPRLGDPKLQALFEQTKQAALLEDARMAATGQLPADVSAQAIQNPGRIYKGATYVKPTAARLGKPSSALEAQRSYVARLQKTFDRSEIRNATAQGIGARMHGDLLPSHLGGRGQSPITQRLGGALSVEKDKLARMEAAAAKRIEPTGLVGHEGFSAGQFHVGQETKRKPFSVNKQPVIGSTNTVGIPLTPGRLTHALTGAAIHRGGLRHDVPNLVAENALESERHAALLRARDFFVQHAQDTPEGIRNPVPIRLDELKNKSFPEPVKALQDAYRAGGSLDKNQTSLLGLSYDALRQKVFPSAEDIGFPQVTAADVPAVKGVKWIDERLLGGLNKPRPLATALQYKGLRHAAGFADAVNNATKLGILYLKPAYAVPNMVGNLFLNFTQQGVYAPVNIGRAITLERKIGAPDVRFMDRLMGQGISSVLASSEGRSIIQRATTAGSNFWSRPVDEPFRRASFLFEARKAGFGDAAKLKSLLHDEGHADELRSVLDRATQAIIDYGDLNPVEQDIIRRVIFFYPWLKGSTKYAGHYLSSHPQQAAVLGRLGEQGKAAQEAQLGPVPPFAEGLFKVGERNGMPLVSNPTAAGILGQSADLAAIAQGVLSGNVPRGRELSSLLTPFFGAGQTALSGYDTFTGRPVQPNLRTFLHELTAGQPIPTLISRLRHDQSQRMFPLTNRDALLQFLFGGLAARPVNPAKLRASAKKAYGPRTR